MNEFILTSCLEDRIVSVHVWDPETGTEVMTFKEGGTLKSRTLSLLGSDYVMAAQQLKPVLTVWPVNSQKPLHAPRLLCTGHVSALAPSPDAAYIAVAVQEKINIYQVCSGFLMGTGIRHFQPITVIGWSSDGSHVVCGGDDGLVTVWNIARIVTRDERPEPEHTFCDHKLPITDIAIGGIHTNARLASVSADGTCRIYSLTSGKSLLTVVFNEVLTSVALNLVETDLFVGGTSGNIFQVNLQAPNGTSVEQAFFDPTMKQSSKAIFSGHEKAVTCLSCSESGATLLSGSNDESVKLWHISSKQCLRTISMKGAVTNSLFIRATKNMFDQNELKRSVILRPFQKSISSEEQNEYCMEICTDHDISSKWTKEKSFSDKHSRSSTFEDIADNSHLEDMKLEISRLRDINEKLYKFSIDHLIRKRQEN
ncbi:WD repeat-containing protein 18 [Nilaparvata lugens]|uniref:WD repeat-containing protein 18 n=1 Tax=Nilaparvata lugens TaxID=108931 RepID=UPI00193E8F4E|nr:WD repeat-containing protein 18 [Nilaparvata lugens]XP_039294503.1 WD repeat-containing protein 18 [Nilaparvata lugens]